MCPEFAEPLTNRRSGSGFVGTWQIHCEIRQKHRCGVRSIAPSVDGDIDGDVDGDIDGDVDGDADGDVDGDGDADLPPPPDEGCDCQAAPRQDGFLGAFLALVLSFFGL